MLTRYSEISQRTAANCVVLMLEEPLPNGDSTERNKKLEKSEMYFVIIYCIEAATKILASGFVLHKDAYLRNGWNILDFVVVVVGQKSTKFGPSYQDFILEPDTNQLFSRCFNIRTHKCDFGWRLLKWFTFLLRTRGHELKSFLTGQYSCFKKSHFCWSDDNHWLLFMSSAVKNTAQEKP
ncbi:putative voltage-dependent R-type calcium channel subunit alpha-1E [Acropora cervicornis]|uniref:Voltage-dependent R-type calcium channel subunit alpha-1E n=1 Tax=Acropora cervicornis TaxID=6130 RepID=A0AAD9VBP0_ACRCE|nr:putative voltage-dependent R-type calcium channel subunit alpha-1E [Acropora cervicornis]